MIRLLASSAGCSTWSPIICDPRTEVLAESEELNSGEPNLNVIDVIDIVDDTGTNEIQEGDSIKSIQTVIKKESETFSNTNEYQECESTVDDKDNTTIYKITVKSEPTEVDINPENEEEIFSDDSVTDDANYLIERNVRSESSDLNETQDETHEVQKCEKKSKSKLERDRQMDEVKRLRNAGKAYMNKNKKLIPEKRLRPPCNETCLLKCYTKFESETRQHIFNSFYNLPDLNSKRKFVAAHLSTTTPTYLHRTGTHRNNNEFYLPDKDGVKIRVCKIFFTSTLSLSHTFIRTVLKKIENNTIEDMRGKHGNHTRAGGNFKEGALNYLRSIPTLRSDYCRSKTNREHTEGRKSIADIHREYVKYCEEKSEPSVKYNLFTQIFREYVS